MTKRYPTALTLLVAAVAVVGIGVVGAGVATAHGSAEFDTGASTVTDGGTTVIPVESDSIDAFEITVGDEDEVGYELRATVTPAEDGVTALVFDHTEAGGGGETVTAQGDGAVEIDYETSLDDAVAPGSYDVALFVGGGEPTDVSTLVVEDGDDDDTERDEDDNTDGNDADETSAEPATVTESDVEEADLVVESAEAEVSVPVDLDDGETVTIRIRSAGDASPGFILQKETTVEDGSASAIFDLSQATHGDRATLTVSGNEALDEPVDRKVLVVDEKVGVEESDGGLDVETPGFGVVAGGLAILAAVLVARRRG
ncbi:BGTF surface domain-containing protein [Halorubrum kocurii]|uniref:Uncharacterized protein n=1 Tax=Halorubrum kocurii JCM 14978 TaxID=1230456 RepID=M0NYY5_9EURY|nr:BGTF surface domain-containing protein [Halorubrum kocurii]EMA62798.1 hypothetical protein C468_10422 [Halorubrum kocurii JCM 14978]